MAKFNPLISILIMSGVSLIVFVAIAFVGSIIFGNLSLPFVVTFVAVVASLGIAVGTTYYAHPKDEKIDWNYIALGGLVALVLIITIPTISQAVSGVPVLSLSSSEGQLFSTAEVSVSQAAPQGDCIDAKGEAINCTIQSMKAVKPYLFFGCVAIIAAILSYYAYTGNK